MIFLLELGDFLTNLKQLAPFFAAVIYGRVILKEGCRECVPFREQPA